jgi:glutamate dehydrogenase
MFKEAYNLAYTQKLKNKDIAENGSKGIIGIYSGFEYLDLQAFKCYIEGIMNIMNQDEGVVYKLPEREILFLGPDENTADKMDLACLYSRKRGNPFWKAFTTGKSPSLGGIPHDI